MDKFSLNELTKVPTDTLFKEKSLQRNVYVLRSCYPGPRVSLTNVKSLGEQKQSARGGRPDKAGPVFCPQRHLSLSVSVQAVFSPAMPTSPTGTYLPIRVVAPVGGPCQSHSPGIRISASCTQDKMPSSAAPWAPGHGGQDLEESTRSEQRKTYDTPVGPPAPPALGPPGCVSPPRVRNSLHKLIPHSSVRVP